MANKTKAPAKEKEKKSAFLVCDGALCVCNASMAPTVAKLKVTSQQKHYINDNKLLATENDITFEVASGTFGNCKNIPSQNKTCTPAFVKWDKPYDDVESLGQKIITEQSELTCTAYGGKVTIQSHGQKQLVVDAHTEGQDKKLATQVFALAKAATKSAQPHKVSVSGIKGERVPNEKFKCVTSQASPAIKSATKQTTDAPDLYLRPGEKAKFTATCKGHEYLVCWRISNLDSGEEPRYFLQKGKEYLTSFPEAGKYQIEAYGTGADGIMDIDTKSDTKKANTADSTCVLDIVVRENELTGIHTKASANLIELGAGVQARAGVPITFEPRFLMPPSADDVTMLSWEVLHGAARISSSQGAANITCTPPNTGATYTVNAAVEGTDQKATKAFKTVQNEVTVIGVTGMGQEGGKIRPGTMLHFQVSDYKFTGLAPDALKKQEQESIRWEEYRRPIVNTVGQGPTFEKKYDREGEYIIKCTVTTAKAGWFSSEKNLRDDWRFEVTRNYPQGIKAGGRAKLGGSAKYQLEGIFDIDADDRNTIVWTLSGPENHHWKSKVLIEHTFRKTGTYSLTASMNGKDLVTPLEIECIHCEITEGYWVDGRGKVISDQGEEQYNQLGVANWGQYVHIVFRCLGLEGETLLLNVWDEDRVTPNDVLIKDLPVKIALGAPENSLHIIRDIHLSPAMKEKAVGGWTDADYARLFFTLTPQNKDLKVKGDGQVRPDDSQKMLKVDSSLRCKAYFADHRDANRYTWAKCTEAVYVQVHTTGLQEEELTLEIMEDKGKEVHTPIYAAETFRVDKYGLASIALKMEEIGKTMPKDNTFKRLYPRITRKNGQLAVPRPVPCSLMVSNKGDIRKESNGMSKAFVKVELSGRDRKACECKRYNLYWGKYLYCDERKKVMQVAENLWGADRKEEMANYLMSIMHLETEGTFSPVAEGKTHTGLLQFGDDAVKTLGTTRDELRKMNFIEQMDYVEKYLSKKKHLLNTMTDLYLLVLKPNAVGQGKNPDFKVFDESVALPDVPYDPNNLFRDPWVTKYGYSDNPSFMKEKGEYENQRTMKNYAGKENTKRGFPGGNTTIREIEEELTTMHYKKGKANAFNDICLSGFKTYHFVEGRAPWMRIALEEALKTKGITERKPPMRGMAKGYLLYCNSNADPTDGDKGPWCAAYLNWCIGKTYNPQTGKRYLHKQTTSSVYPSWDTTNYKKIDVPIFGCLVVYSTADGTHGHTGFLFGLTTTGEYIVLGGNQEDTIGFDQYGEYTSKSKLKKFKGFYLPADYEPTEADALKASDVYADKTELNKLFDVIAPPSEGKTN